MRGLLWFVHVGGEAALAATRQQCKCHFRFGTPARGEMSMLFAYGRAAMRHRLTPLLLMIGGLLNAHVARAQETGRAGLTMGYPGAVGMIWHVAERVALRPEFSFASSAADTATSGTDATSFGVGVSGLFYVRTWDNLRAYVSPRFVYGRGTTTSKGTATF